MSTETTLDATDRAIEFLSPNRGGTGADTSNVANNQSNDQDAESEDEDDEAIPDLSVRVEEVSSDDESEDETLHSIRYSSPNAKCLKELPRWTSLC